MMKKSWLLAGAVLLLVALIFFLISQQKVSSQLVKPEQPPVSVSKPQASAPPNNTTTKPVLSNQTSSPPNLSASQGVEPPSIRPNKILKIASWNLQIFGDKKADNATLMAFYSIVMRQYDVIFIQEIRDVSGTAFPRLCSLMQGYQCLNSSRAGRSSSKEQYGIIYKGINVTWVTDYNPDSQDRWERPPFQVTFKQGNYVFTALVEHIKPDDAPQEIAALENLTSSLPGNVVVLGDLNADCSYYSVKKDFWNWTWAIKTGTDTTSGNTSCTYDRMIFNQEMANEYASSGVYSENITAGVSDHYLIWSEIGAEEAN